MNREQSDALGDAFHFVFEDASWEFYEAMLRHIGDGATRVTYDHGRMEVLSSITRHEIAKPPLESLISMLAFELDMQKISWGLTTFRQKSLAVGLEPDACFYFNDLDNVRGRKRVNLKRHPTPDLVLEIDIFKRWLDRISIFAALGVPEIWRYDERRIECLYLVDGKYRVRKKSRAFPFLEPSKLIRFTNMSDKLGQLAMWNAFEAWVKRHFVK